ncbi:MAG: GxxExxY protein [Candidatus Doudnabacteria bacterium CG10_big_fil_rev_8_21_14_0_10_42_18]|uniref:GxxExxY protein n=1 Tax=Candidatus Doudnabacteria bacterium CG10_big_fil_rev_8_21_14_0_10_42_18 TaxID=1974552 RepID=A0A2H0VAS3_9BACT|nr:MAG: GxxExxY protein [Candidatus Doudnabacteria bacterium CG10_big_fil_rev_8_21_14_0_10_42_18]
MAYTLRRKDLLYTDLTDKIIKAVFKVYNELGDDLLEKYYQKALALELKNLGLKFLEQVAVPLSYNEATIGRYFLDFIVENKVVLEIKKHNNFGNKNIEQLLSYLKVKKLKLGLLINFIKIGVRIKRIVNLR